MNLFKINESTKNFILISLIIILSLLFSGCSSKNISMKNTADNDKIKISFIDVGQADSILIQQGENSMLIDGGNREDSKNVEEYILNQGIKKLDYIIGTHPHEDHIGGLKNIVNDFEIGKIYMPKVTSNTKTFENLVNAIKDKKMKINVPTVGNNFKLGEADCTILSPNSSSYKDLNNYSIVLKVTFKNNSFLFTGDAESISEKEILNKDLDIKADVLKVGHHGSNSSTSDEFLKEVNPKYAVISVGKGNDYGHPHKETLTRLKENSVKVYRTDQLGTIICTSDGNNIEFNSNSKKE